MLCGLMPLAYAEQFKEVGAYKIHYNAVNTSMLQPKIAKSYQIIRSRTRGLLTVAVHKEGKAVAAEIKATVKNLNQQLQTLKMRPDNKDEEKVIYYIGDFSFSDKDKLIFDLKVTPKGREEPIEVNFTQQFFAE